METQKIVETEKTHKVDDEQYNELIGFLISESKGEEDIKKFFALLSELRKKYKDNVRVIPLLNNIEMLYQINLDNETLSAVEDNTNYISDEIEKLNHNLCQVNKPIIDKFLGSITNNNFLYSFIVGFSAASIYNYVTKK